MYRTWTLNKNRLLLSLLISTVPPLICGFLLRADISSANLSPFPPLRVLAPLWMLFALLGGVGFSGILSLRKGIGNQVYIFFLQLFVSLCWPFLCFKWQARSFALVWLGILIACAAGMIILFFMRLKWAGLLQIPYFIWLLMLFRWNYLSLQESVTKIFKVFSDFLDIYG